VHSLKLILASGEIIRCSHHQNSDLFWATVAGMGLTGIITEVEFSLRPIQTAYINSHTIKARNLDEALALFHQYERQYQYSAAWIDCLASGQSLGQSILMFGNHAEIANLPPDQQAEPLKLKSKRRLTIPFRLQVSPQHS
jgi:FAD/FMN-containing dehydrogenase